MGLVTGADGAGAASRPTVEAFMHCHVAGKMAAPFVERRLWRNVVPDLHMPTIKIIGRESI
jgi:hypothetical protein